MKIKPRPFMAVFLVLAMAANIAAISTASKKQPGNGLGFIEENTNPYAYMFASIHDVAIIGREAATNIEFSPAHTSLLHNEWVLFCGNRVEAFTSDGNSILRGPLVVTYRRKASRVVEGVPCYDLVSVDTVKEKPLLP